MHPSFRLQSRAGGVEFFRQKDFDLTAALVHGGEFLFGITPAEVTAAEAIHEDALSGFLPTIREASPVYVPDLLVSVTPVSDELIAQCVGRTADDGLFRFAYTEYNKAEECSRVLGGRIPTEAEFEYLWRAGTHSLFPWGDGIDDRETIARHLGRDSTDPHLGIEWANAFGLQCLHEGEWCSGYFSDYSATRTAVPADERVARGGGALFWPWQNEEWIWCVCAGRIPASSLFDFKAHFRVVYDL